MEAILPGKQQFTTCIIIEFRSQQSISVPQIETIVVE